MFTFTRSFRQVYSVSTLTRRSYSTGVTQDIRKRLTDELKSAMKSRDSVKSTTIRSILSEVYSADKAQPDPVSSSSIVSIIRKGVIRRTDAATEFDRAQRPDLAEKERKEAELLSQFVPALMKESDVDRVLQEVISEQKPSSNDKKALGMVFKAFYTKVDRSLVDTDLVKKRAEALLSPSP